MRWKIPVWVLVVFLVLSLVLVAGCRQDPEEEIPDPDEDGGIIDDDSTADDAEPGEMMTLTLYFRNQSFEPGPSAPEEVIRPVTREVPKTMSVARAAINELIKGPTEEEQAEYGVGTVITPDAVLLDLALADGLLVIDLSYEGLVNTPLAMNHEELAFVQSFVTTLTEFDAVDSVWVLKDGRPWMAGYLGWSAPLARRGENMEFTLYYGDERAIRDNAPGEYGFVRPVTATIQSPPATVWENCPFIQIIEMLAQSPGDGLVATLPPGNQAHDAGVDYDLSSRLLTVHLSGDTTMGHQATRVLIESLVYTFTDIPAVDQVIATLNGEVWHDFHFVWEEPYGRQEVASAYGD